MINKFSNIINNEVFNNNLYLNNLKEEFLNYLDNFKYKNGDICLFNTIIPKEIILAYGKNPVYMLGGSLDFKNTYDDLFPRDIDKVVHSSYLMFKEYTKNYDKEVVAVIAFQNDSYRKLAELLKKEGVSVIGIDIFTLSHLNKAEDFFNKELKELSRKLSRRYFRVIDLNTFKGIIKSSILIREELRRLQKIKEENKGTINNIAYYFLLNIYYFNNSHKELYFNLKNYIDNLDIIKKDLITVSLTGSPLFLPNTKIKDILNDFDVDIVINENEVNMLTLDYEYYKNKIEFLNRRQLFKYLTDIYYRQSVNLFTSNKLCSSINNSFKTNGIIYIVLKGQVSYDFNHLKIEEKINDKSVLRLETDYFNEDKEQIKIRLEAFVEMLKALNE